MLQTRNAKRPAQAAVRFARDAVDEGLLDREQALMTIEPDKLVALLVPTFDPKADYEVLRHRRRRRAGRRQGRGRLHRPGGRRRRRRGPRRRARPPRHQRQRRRRLPRRQGHPHEPRRQGLARRAGRPRAWASRASTAASGLRVDLETRVIRVGDNEIHAGDFIAINGTTGEVTLEDVPLVDPRRTRRSPRSSSPSRPCSAGPTTSAGWACARTPTRRTTPRKARELGAEGIGLCRTEHMFMAEDRQPKMRAMIMADDRESRKDALAELLPLQQEDFEGLFEAMKGLPVTIRLLDPPLHEFLPGPAGPFGAGRARADRVHGRPRGARAPAGATERDLRGEPDARHARLPARDPLPRDLRDAGPRDPARGEGDGRAAAPRDHDPARRLRAGARDHARAGGPDRRRGGAARGRRTTPSGP